MLLIKDEKKLPIALNTSTMPVRIRVPTSFAESRIMLPMSNTSLTAHLDNPIQVTPHCLSDFLMGKSQKNVDHTHWSNVHLTVFPFVFSQTVDGKNENVRIGTFF